jgi:hypothetical protein
LFAVLVFHSHSFCPSSCPLVKPVVIHRPLFFLSPLFFDKQNPSLRWVERVYLSCVLQHTRSLLWFSLHRTRSSFFSGSATSGLGRLLRRFLGS